MDGEADAADDEAEHGRGKRYHEVHGKRPEIPGRKRRQRRPERDQRSGEAEHRSQPDTEVETGQETLRFKLKVIQDLFSAGGRGSVRRRMDWRTQAREGGRCGRNRSHGDRAVERADAVAGRGKAAVYPGCIPRRDEKEKPASSEWLREVKSVYGF